MDYGKIIMELWKIDISDKPTEGIRIKKIITNISFGLLDKNTTKVNNNYAFDILQEALYYQNKIGGRINRIWAIYIPDGA